MISRLGARLAKLSLRAEEGQGKAPKREPGSKSLAKRLNNRLCSCNRSEAGKIEKKRTLPNNVSRPQDDQPQFGLPDMDEAAMAQYWPACQLAVLSCFPDMCPEYLTKVAASFNWDSEQIITSILDQQEKGRPYPTQQNTSKRKRADSCAEASNLKNNFEKDDTRLANKGDAFVRRYNHVG